MGCVEFTLSFRIPTTMMIDRSINFTLCQQYDPRGFLLALPRRYFILISAVKYTQARGIGREQKKDFLWRTIRGGECR